MPSTASIVALAGLPPAPESSTVGTVIAVLGARDEAAQQTLFALDVALLSLAFFASIKGGRGLPRCLAVGQWPSISP